MNLDAGPRFHAAVCCPPSLPGTNMVLSDLLAQSAERFPEKTALICPDENITFRALHEQSIQVAARLRKLGIGPGSRVAILHENTLPAVVFFWGVVESGAQVVDVPCQAGASTISGIFAESKPAALAASDRQLQRFSLANADWVPSVVLTARTPRGPVHGCDYHVLTDIMETEPSDRAPGRTDESEIALVAYTSGTTGRPKGVKLSHRNLLSNVLAVNELMKLTSADSILLSFPLHFIHGRMQLLTHALIGGTVAFSAGFQSPQQVVDEMSRYEVTGFSGVPYHFSLLLEQATIAATRPPSLRYLVVTGGALPPNRLKKLSEALPGVAIHIAYGQTETSPRITSLRPQEALANPTSCGLPVPGVRIEIVDEYGVTLPPGVVGEVVVSGPNVMAGYVSGDEIISGKIDGFGRLHTGDLGKVDRNGYLYLTGRKSELIKCAGERVFPREIEAVLDTHPAVRESVAFGLPDDLLGEKIVACVALRPDADLKPEELQAHCSKFLPQVRVPREVRFSDGLPKTSSGKINRSIVATHFFELELGKTRAA